MKSKNILLGILAITLVFGMTAVGCDNGSTDNKGNNPQKAIFQGIAAGYKYILTITENKSRAVYIAVTGDSYELRITKTGEADKVSKGTVSAVDEDGTLTLQPETASSPTFSVSMNGADIASITGSITLADGTTVTAGDFDEGGEEPSEPDVTFTTIAEMATWLTAQPNSKTYIIKLNVSDLGGSVETSGSAGKALWDNSNKYVILDLSGSTITTIPEKAFGGCWGLESITIPNSVTSIGKQAFSNVRLITSITIPNSVTSIGNAAFQDCSSLTSVTIPNSVTIIETYAFQSCSSLTSVTIGNGVTSIELGAFLLCDKLTSVTFQGTISSSGFGGFSGDLRTKYLAGGIGTYTTTAPVSSTSVWTKTN
jgi:hypothetical protein